nr:hypothetical protein [Tanacetum cinerariifolium]
EKNVGQSSAGPTPSSYANVAGKPNRTKVNFCILFTQAGNGIDVVVLVESIRAINERFANTAYGFFLGKRVAYPVVANYGRSRYAKAIIKLRADVELKDNIVVAMPKITREGYYTCNIRVEYEWKPPRCACCKVFSHVQEECPKNIGAGETKNLKKPSQTSKGIKNKNKNIERTKEVSMSNSFNVLTSFVNDVELGTNEGISNLASQKANSSGSSFWNVETSTPNTTLIIEKIDRIEKLIID